MTLPGAQMQASRDKIREAVRGRLLAQRSLLYFCKHVDPKYPTDAPHVKLMAEKLQQVATFIESGGKEGIGRLMIFLPPRYWKSQTASRKFPAWLLGRNPNLRIILTSYGADLATKHSREVRDLISSERYQAVFGTLSSREEPVLLDADSRSAASWDLSGHNGGMIAAGVGGAITGFGANLFIVDDPMKSRDEASSAARRELVYEWYRSTAYTRLEDNGAIVLVMTRWDVEDLAGDLLNLMASDGEADQWDIVFLPALALEAEAYPKSDEDYQENLLRGTFIPRHGDQLKRAAGSPLWPKKHDEYALKSIAANIGDFEFTAQYQQLPRLAEGEFLDDRDFDIVEKAPEGLRWHWYCDLALGESETSDNNATAGVAMEGEDLYIRDMVTIRNLDDFLPEVRSLMLSQSELGSVWGIEDVAFQKLVVKDFLKDKALASVEIYGVKIAGMGDKVDRARAWRRRAKQGKVHLVRGKWNNSFIRVATAFPRGRRDDEVDVVSGGVQMIADDAAGAGRTVTSLPVVTEAEMFV
jgi:hypothetical protein